MTTPTTPTHPYEASGGPLPGQAQIDRMRLFFEACRESGIYPRPLIETLAAAIDDIGGNHQYTCCGDECPTCEALREANAAIRAHRLIQAASASESAAGPVDAAGTTN